MNRLLLMKPQKLTVLLGALFFLISFVFLPQSVAGQEGGLRLEGLDGSELRETDFGDGITIVIFWASWSPRCRDIVQRVNAIVAQWQGKARVVTVNFQEQPAEAQAFLDDQRLDAPVFLDTEGSFAKKYSVTTLPSLLVFDKGEKVLTGRLPADANRAIQQAIGNSS